MAERLIDMRRSSDPMSQAGRQYLSDSLTPWFGTWYRTGGTPSFAMTGLPDDPSITGRVYYSFQNFHSMGIEFDTPQNLTNCFLEFWMKCATNDPAIYIYISMNPFATFSTNYRRDKRIYNDGTAPTTWTFHQYSISPTEWGQLALTPTTTTTGSFTLVAANVKSILFYLDTMASPPVQMDIAGFNIRRL